MTKGIYAYYVGGLRQNVLEELAHSLVFQLLLMNEHHPLHAPHWLKDLRSIVRHATRMVPYFVDESGHHRKIERDAM